MTASKQIYMVINQDYTPPGQVIIAMGLLVILTVSFFGYALIYQDDEIEVDNFTTTISSTIFMEKFYDSIEDGLNFRVTFSEIINTKIYIFIMLKQVESIQYLNLGSLSNESKDYWEFTNTDEIKFNVEDYYSSVYLLYFLPNYEEQDGKSIDVSFFEQRGKLYQRTGAFYVSMIFYLSFSIILYLGNSKQLTMILFQRKYKKSFGTSKEQKNMDLRSETDDILESIFAQKKSK